jgi:tRNA U55 pseudouridine synthase TruB
MLGEMQELQRLQTEQQKEEDAVTGQQMTGVPLPSLNHSLSVIELMIPIA